MIFHKCCCQLAEKQISLYENCTTYVYLVNDVMSELLNSLNHQTFSTVMAVHTTNSVQFEPSVL